MIDPTGGEIRIDGKNNKSVDPVKLRRKIGYVIQQTGLMPHMTVYENIIMVPKLLKWDEAKMKKTAKDLLQRVNLPEEFLDRYPQQLSGGQQQRIGVVRAQAADQDIILMDEPFGALDPITSDTLQNLVKTLQQKLGKTIIFVTHDMDEAVKLADRICIMSEGEIVQFDTPNNILKHPANDFVSEFIGQNRLIQDRPNLKVVDDAMISAITITSEKTIDEAVTLMRDRRVDVLFVTNLKGKLVGCIDIEDLNEGYRKGSDIIDMMDR